MLDTADLLERRFCDGQATHCCRCEAFVTCIGFMVAQQYFKKLEGTEDLWEVRAEFGGDAFRMLGFWDAGRLIILTNGFDKKTQKTPEREIALAEQRKRDHLNRRKQK